MQYQNKKISSVSPIALDWAKDDDVIKQYQEIIKPWDDMIRANVQNCILYAGALLDENVAKDHDKDVYTKIHQFRKDVEIDLDFNEAQYRLILRVMLDLCNFVYKRDKKRGVANPKDFYQQNYNECKAWLIETRDKYAM